MEACKRASEIKESPHCSRSPWLEMRLSKIVLFGSKKFENFKGADANCPAVYSLVCVITAIVTGSEEKNFTINRTYKQ